MQVLNMRPQEILGMVEEAAGTRMFEERKDRAQRTMGKKEKRVHEITDLLNEEITPKLDKLREEKRAFLAWQKTCSELERQVRVLRAAEWTELRDRLKTKQAEIDKKQQSIAEVGDQTKRLQGEIKAAEKDVAEVVEKRDQEMRKGGRFKKRGG
jgi:structural maintenance of chromosome 2